MSEKIIKTASKSVNGKPRGHCYDGTGWFECSFWHRTGVPEESRCMLFGGREGVKKYASESLRICDKIYGVDYNGDV
jgi:hypothetical protein